MDLGEAGVEGRALKEAFFAAGVLVKGVEAPVGREVAAEGGVAAAAEGAEECALERDGFACGGVTGGGEGIGVGGTRLEGDGALADSRDHFFQREDIEGEAVPGIDAEAREAGAGEEGGIGVAAGDFPEAGVDVAADFGVCAIRVQEAALGAAAGAAGGDEAGAREALTAHEDIVDGLAREESGEGEGIRIGGGQVFGGVHGEVGAAGEEGIFEFLGKEAFAALFFHGKAALLVAGGDEFEDLEACPGKVSLQLRAGEFGLPEGEAAAAGGEGEDFFHGSGGCENAAAGGFRAAACGNRAMGGNQLP